jgi:hypothetical protein
MPKIYALENVPQSVQLYGFVENGTLKFVPQQAVIPCLMYDRPPSIFFSKVASKIVPTLALIFVPQICCYTACTDLHSTACSQQIKPTLRKQNSSLGFVL